MNRVRLYRRMARRETHSSRSVPATAVVVLVALVAVWTGVETVLLLLGRPALLIAPPMALVAAADLGAAAPVPTTAAGAATILLGLVLIALALLPGRRRRHHRMTDRAVIVIDDRVTASSFAASVASVARVRPEHVRASVARSRMSLRITPQSGSPVDVAAVRQRVESRIGSEDLRPALRSRVTVGPNGVVGG